MLPFPPVATTAVLPRSLPRPPAFSREFPREFSQPIHQAAAVVRSRRFGFYLDVLGAALVMVLFVAAAILV